MKSGSDAGYENVQFWFYQTISNTLKMGAESAPETLENFHALARLSARHFIEGKFSPVF
jgi:hypothetical protein